MFFRNIVFAGCFVFFQIIYVWIAITVFSSLSDGMLGAAMLIFTRFVMLFEYCRHIDSEFFYLLNKRDNGTLGIVWSVILPWSFIDVQGLSIPLFVLYTCFYEAITPIALFFVFCFSLVWSICVYVTVPKLRCSKLHVTRAKKRCQDSSVENPHDP